MAQTIVIERTFSNEQFIVLVVNQVVIVNQSLQLFSF